MKYIFIILIFVAAASADNDELQTISSEPLQEKNIVIQVKTSTWVAVGLDALGVAVIGFGVWQNSKAVKLHKDYKALVGEDADYKGAQEKVENAVTRRNVAYIIGSALLTAGVGVHIWF